MQSLSLSALNPVRVKFLRHSRGRNKSLALTVSPFNICSIVCISHLPHTTCRQSGVLLSSFDNADRAAQRFCLLATSDCPSPPPHFASQGYLSPFCLVDAGVARTTSCAYAGTHHSHSMCRLDYLDLLQVTPFETMKTKHPRAPALATQGSADGHITRQLFKHMSPAPASASRLNAVSIKHFYHLMTVPWP